MQKKVAELELLEWDTDSILKEFIDVFENKGYMVILDDSRVNPKLILAKEED